VYDDLDDLGDGVWIAMDRHNVAFDNDVEMVVAAARNGSLGMPVYAVNMQTADRIKDGKVGEQLVTAAEAAKPFHEKAKQIATTVRSIAKYKGMADKLENGRNLHSKLQREGKARGLTLLKARIAQLEKRVDGFMWLRGAGNISTNDAMEAGREAGMARSEAFNVKYPLLAHVWDSAPMDEVVNYMEMVDKRG
jgi:hypothetical protein